MNQKISSWPRKSIISLGLIVLAILLVSCSSEEPSPSESANPSVQATSSPMATSVPEPTSIPASEAPTGPQTHLVLEGETLLGIASLYGVTEENLIVWNYAQYPSLLEGPYNLPVGQTLIVSGDLAQTLPTPAPAPQTEYPHAPIFTARLQGDVTLGYLNQLITITENGDYAYTSSSGNTYYYGRLNLDGLDRLIEILEGTPVLDASAHYDRATKPDVTPPGRGFAIMNIDYYGNPYTSPPDQANVKISFVAIDPDESQWFETSAPRRELDELVTQLLNPESLFSGRHWQQPPGEEFIPQSFTLLMSFNPDVDPTFYADFPHTDITEVSVDFLSDPSNFGTDITRDNTAGGIRLRCGTLNAGQNTQLRDNLKELGLSDTESLLVDFSRTLTWNEGNGAISLTVSPRMPDGYPDCTQILP